MSLAITGTLSAIITPVFLIYAPLMADTLLTDKRTLYPLLAVTPVVPIIAVSSVLRGYFQGSKICGRLPCPRFSNKLSGYRSSPSARQHSFRSASSMQQRAPCCLPCLANWLHSFICSSPLNTKENPHQKTFFQSLKAGRTTFRADERLAPNDGQPFYREPVMVLSRLS